MSCFSDPRQRNAMKQINMHVKKVIAIENTSFSYHKFPALPLNFQQNKL